MKKNNFREKVRYTFDRLLSQSSAFLIMLIFSIVITIVLAIGTVSFFIGDEHNWIYQVWLTLMHTLDPGALASDSTYNVPYLIMMSLATLCGLMLTSMLIGIITTGFEAQLNNLKKGSSVVQVHDQTTIIGFNDNIYSLLNELIEANKNKKKAYIVILGDIPKEQMEDSITAHIPHTFTTKIVCRSGRLYEPYSLKLCSVEKSRSVIVNTLDDAQTIRVLLALATYARKNQLLNEDLRYVATIRNEENIEAARIAGENRAKVVYANDSIARIVVNTCRQHGLSQVLTELLDFDGDEMYIEHIPALVGKTFGEAMTCLKNATLIGLSTKHKGTLNPNMDRVITSEDGLVIIEEDDGEYVVCDSPEYDGGDIENFDCEYQVDNSLVILGSNCRLPIILKEYDRFVSSGTKITIVDEELGIDLDDNYENLELVICNQKVNRAFLEQLIQNGTSNILLLNDDSHNTEEADANTLVNLLLLRDISNSTHRKISITTEMHHAENQKLAACARVDDFVIGSNFSSLLMAQISENIDIAPIIDDLLDEDGSELYIRPAECYVKLGVPVDMFTLTKIASRKGEVFIGYRIIRDGNAETKINLDKSSKIVFESGDQIVVIAEN